MTIYILGGGPAGMALVDGLVDKKQDGFVLVERGPILGGLARTIYWEGVGYHDLGPHKIFSLDRQLVSRVESLLLPSQWLTRNKSSSIYMKGCYLPYPPSPLSLGSVFGYAQLVRMVASYIRARLIGLFHSRAPETFEEDLTQRLGPELYRVLFRPIALKLWGDPRQLDVKLSHGRVQTPSLLEVLGRMFKIKKSSNFEALTFRYPRGGLGRLWNAIEQKTRGSGVFLLEHTITGIRSHEGRVTAIDCVYHGDVRTLEVGSNDFVISTLPLTLTTQLLSEVLPKRITEIANRVIALNDLLLVFLHVDLPSLLKESWVFVPDPNIIFHRLSEQESFDPGMTPSGSIVCCEIMSSQNRPLAERSDEILIADTLKGLDAMGYHGFRVLNQRVIRLPKSYPVFRRGFEDGLTEILSHLDSFANFRTIGRQGAFNYIGTLDAMDIGYGFVRWLAKPDVNHWLQERERTSHYPVLD